MNIPLEKLEPTQRMELTPQEQRIIQTLRLLPKILPDGVDQVEDLVWRMVGKNLKWSYDDPASLDLAMEFAALDPFLRRESEAISAEFACTEGDGLEDY